MAKNKLRLQIITPTEVKVDEQVDMVVMRCSTGDMGILPGHEPLFAMLEYGVLRILDEQEERRMAVFGGLAEVRRDGITILTRDAEWPEDIDRARAEADREHAEKRLEERSEDIMIQSSQFMLRQALVRIEVSSYPLIGNTKPKEVDDDMDEE